MAAIFFVLFIILPDLLTEDIESTERRYKREYVRKLEIQLDELMAIRYPTTYKPIKRISFSIKILSFSIETGSILKNSNKIFFFNIERA